MQLFLTLLALVVLSLPGVTMAEAPQGGAIANACAACHGPDGRSQGAIPSIDTIATADLLAALRAFRADTRQGTVMNRIAKGLSDEEIKAVVSYVATRHAR